MRCLSMWFYKLRENPKAPWCAFECKAEIICIYCSCNKGVLHELQRFVFLCIRIKFWYLKDSEELALPLGKIANSKSLSYIFFFLKDWWEDLDIYGIGVTEQILLFIGWDFHYSLPQLSFSLSFLSVLFFFSLCQCWDIELEERCVY